MIKIVAIVFFLAGCQSTPSDLTGKWTGKIGPFKSAFKFNNDGSGVFCYSGRKSYKTEWTKYKNGIIHTEGNTDVIIKSLTDNTLVVEVDNFGVMEYVFKKDQLLKDSDWFCRKKLSG